MTDEQKIKSAFIVVKKDIVNIQRELLELSIRQQRIMEMLSKIDKKSIKTTSKPKIRIKTATRSPKKVFVASKTGKKFHIKDCPFAKNIKPKSKLVFKSKNTALNQGFKPCSCVK